MSEVNPYEVPETLNTVTGGGSINLSPLTPKGRLGRMRYLVYSSTSYLVAVVFFAIFLGVFVGSEGLKSLSSSMATGQMGFAGLDTGLIIGVVALYSGMVFFQVVFAAKRLHDLNMSGWWAALFFASLVVGLIPVIGGVLSIITSLIAFILWLVLLFTKGKKEANSFGDAPPPNTALVKVGFGIYIAFGVLMIAGLLVGLAKMPSL